MHKIAHVLNGPSSKGDNLNNLIKNIEDDKLVNIEKYLEEGLINMEQGIIALRYSKGKEELESTLRTMGLLADIEEYA